MLKILLISAPYIDLYGPIKSAAGRYFPLGLGYIAAFLRKNGYHISLYEPEVQKLNFNDISKIFAAEKPDIVGISCATPNFYNAVELAKLAKKFCNCKVILGGVHASAIPEFIIKQYNAYFDYVVVGEGEYTMLELLECLGKKQIPTGVSGLCFWDEGKVILTPCRPFISDLDSLPYPARDLIPYNLFSPNVYNIRYNSCFTILTSRGCSFNCSFCASWLTLGKKYRTHSAEYVLDEMSMLKTQYKARQFIITDDTFTINKKRLIDICEGMIKKRLNIEWFCFSQITAVDGEILKLMKRAGCYNIGFGIESVSQRILKIIGKPHSSVQCKTVIDAANRLGIKTQAFFVFGQQGETIEEINDTINFAIHLNPTLAFFNMLVPYPGTRDFSYFFKDVPLDKIDWKNFVAIGTNSAINKPDNLDLEKIVYNANLRFYKRPSQLLHIISKIKTLYELWSYIKGGFGLLSQMLLWKKSNPIK